MTKTYFFDTDCLASFLWVDMESILTTLYSGGIVLPFQVFSELRCVPQMRQKVDALKDNGSILVESMEMDSAEFIDYLNMTSFPLPGTRIIGNGEAAGIAMAKNRGGILASNNLKDIIPYVRKYKIEHVTTGDIMIEAMKAGIINEAEGNSIWAAMLAKNRLLPTDTFSDYLKGKQYG